jgi:hypothetical protein
MIMEAIHVGRGTSPIPPEAFAEPQASVAVGGDLGAEIAALAVQNGDAERTTSHAARDAEEQAEAQHDAAEVQAMRDEASSMRMEGVFDAATAVGTGCVKAECPSAAFVCEAYGKLGDGVWHAAQHTDEANAAGQRAAADQAKSAAQNQGEAAADADAYVKAAFDFYREYTSTAAQTQSAAIHRA